MSEWRWKVVRYRFSIVEMTAIATGVHFLVQGRWMVAVLAAIIGGLAQALLEWWPE